MPSQPLRPATLALVLTLLQACSGSGGPPDAPSAYRERLDEAWALAGRGENPTGPCTMVVGVAVGRSAADAGARPDAVRAYEACYVDVTARYLHAMLDQAGPDAGDAGPCGRLLTHMLIGRMSLGSFAADLGLARADLDGRLAEIVGDRIRSECPDQATAILGG